ncbi:MAG: hypothetical protein ABI036_07200 [Fibrobacteria bacterium]
MILLKNAWSQPAPIRFHNGYLDDLRNRFRLASKVPLPEMPNFFPSGAEGEMVFQGRNVLHLDSALKEQPLFAHLESLRELVGRVAERKAAFPDFIEALNRISIPAAWRNEIVNGLFDHAETSSRPAPKSPAPGLSSDIDKLLGMLDPEASGGSKLSPSLGKFLEEVGRDSTGFTLRDGAARQLHLELAHTLQALRGSLLRHGALAEALGFMAGLQRLAKATKSRDRQTVHLWSEVPENPAAELLGENADEGADFAVAMVLLDPLERDGAFLRRIGSLAAQLGCPLLVQLPGEDLPTGEVLEALADCAPRKRTYFFAGGVASLVEGENCVFRPAALAFLEGLVESKETVDHYLHRSLVLEDQDVITEKGQARATDRLLDLAQLDGLSAKRINRVNGARNRSTAAFPLLTAWEDA